MELGLREPNSNELERGKLTFPLWKPRQNQPAFKCPNHKRIHQAIERNIC
jgi:hypothetical protein